MNACSKSTNSQTLDEIVKTANQHGGAEPIKGPMLGEISKKKIP